LLDLHYPNFLSHLDDARAYYSTKLFLFITQSCYMFSYVHTTRADQEKITLSLKPSETQGLHLTFPCCQSSHQRHHAMSSHNKRPACICEMSLHSVDVSPKKPITPCFQCCSMFACMLQVAPDSCPSSKDG
jgi:hypothetical protein